MCYLGMLHLFFLISKIAATEVPFLLVVCPVVKICGSLFILTMGIFFFFQSKLFKIRKLRRWGYMT